MNNTQQQEPPKLGGLLTPSALMPNLVQKILTRARPSGAAGTTAPIADKIQVNQIEEAKKPSGPDQDVHMAPSGNSKAHLKLMQEPRNFIFRNLQA